jgi:serine/threonine protein kinase
MTGTASSLDSRARNFGPAPQPGDIVADRYRIDEMVGEGGMGVVAKATHLELGSHVAIKFLNPEALERRDGLQRFAQEARTIANLKSPHVVKVFDVNSRAARPYMVMELLDGQDLDGGIVRGEIPAIGDVIRYFRQACDALIEAHDAGVIHRDLKPANLFLTKLPSGARIVKILDFGIAKVFQSDDPASPASAKLTGMREVFGSPAYMSPEQIASASSVDVRSDVWSLGVAFYEILTCKQPFVGEFPDIFLSIATREPVPIATYRGDVPPGLEAVILKCLCKGRADRFQSMREVDDALAVLQQDLVPETPSSLRDVMRARAASAPDHGPAPDSGVVTAATAVMPVKPRVPTAVMPMDVVPASVEAPESQKKTRKCQCFWRAQCADGPDSRGGRCAPPGGPDAAGPCRPCRGGPPSRRRRDRWNRSLRRRRTDRRQRPDPCYDRRRNWRHARPDPRDQPAADRLGVADQRYNGTGDDKTGCKAPRRDREAGRSRGRRSDASDDAGNDVGHCYAGNHIDGGAKEHRPLRGGAQVT